jgi:glycosyltransferase involved in cell wall biosynthesis
MEDSHSMQRQYYANGADRAPRDAASPHMHVHVCMHVLGTARTDVRVMREATALAEAGFAVTVVDLERDRSRAREEDLSGIHLKHIIMPGWFVPTRFKPWFVAKMAGVVVRGALAVARTPADVYHAHDDTALPACYAAARLRRQHLVFDAHELPLVQPNLARWRGLSTVARWALRRMMLACAGVITVSPPIVRELQRRYGGRTAVVVRNVPVFAPATGSRRLHEQLCVPPDTRIALYQGGLQTSRSLDILVRAARFLDPGHAIVLMGTGSGHNALEQLITDEGAAGKVTILPPVPYVELLQWTASADLGLIVYQPSYSPNVRFCLPNKLFEYLMSGVPVLTSSLEACAEVLERFDVGRVVEDLTPVAVGRAISNLLNDRQTLSRMRTNALAASASELRWDVEQHQLVGLYEELLTMNPRLPSSRVSAYQWGRERART